MQTQSGATCGVVETKGQISLSIRRGNTFVDVLLTAEEAMQFAKNITGEVNRLPMPDLDATPKPA